MGGTDQVLEGVFEVAGEVTPVEARIQLQVEEGQALQFTCEM